MTKGKGEELVEWYLRLNGYFVIPNFILHPLLPGGSQRTEVDLLGVRFPHQIEIVCNSERQKVRMENDGNLVNDEFVDCLIVSVKGVRSEAEVNKSMKDFQNLRDIIRRFGVVHSEKDVDKVASELLRDKKSVWNHFQTRFLAVAGKHNGYSTTKQIIFREIVEFILERFRSYCHHKVDTEQWEGVGKRILSNCQKSSQDIIQMIFTEG
jgi:hypothetical protein